MEKGKPVSEEPTITQQQFAQITAKMFGVIFLGQDPTQQPPTDCPALFAFIQAAQAIYTRDCPGP